eukprot:scaffold5256_cov192-Ochromonas_danica.AAC.4
MDMNMMMIEDDGEDETNSLTNFSILAGRLQSAIVNACEESDYQGGSSPEMLRLLYQEGVDVQEPFEDRGQSVLAWTCCQQLAFTEVVEAVLAHPSLNVNDQDEDGDTVLMTVCRNGDSKVAFYLLNHPDIDVNIQNRDGQTALFFAEYQSRKPDAALIAALKEKGEAALLREVVSLTGYASSAAVAYMRSQSTFKGRVSGYFAFKG